MFDEDGMIGISIGTSRGIMDDEMARWSNFIYFYGKRKRLIFYNSRDYHKSRSIDI